MARPLDAANLGRLTDGATNFHLPDPAPGIADDLVPPPAAPVVVADFGYPGQYLDSVADPAPTATGGASGTATSSQTVTLAGSGLVFVNTYTANVSAAYKSAIIAAENFYQSKITTGVTLNFTFDTMNGGAFGFVASNNFSTIDVTYAQLRGALASHAISADDKAAVASLPLSDPTGSHDFSIPIGLAEALGFVDATGAGFGGDTTFLNTALTYFYNQGSPVAGAFDAVSALEHEISEGGLGRIAGLGLSPNNIWSTLDLFRYSSSGVRDLTGGHDGKNTFFSINGTTLLTQFHNPIDTFGNNDGDDAGDWEISGDSFGFANEGVVNPVSNTDVRELDILGWTRAGPIVSAGQTLTISSGHTSTGVTVLSSGTLLVASGGTASATLDQGTENVSGGTDIAATVNSGGLQFVYSGGRATGTHIADPGTVNGAGQYVSSGGTASAAVVSDGGFQAVYGGFASGTIVSSGGGQFVAFGGTASGAIVRDGGVQEVFSAGTARGTTISLGGFEIVSSGSLASATTIRSGGILIVSAGGRASGGTVSNGGVERVYGTASGGVVSSGGREVAFSGGVASGAIVRTGGVEVVSSGGTTRGTVLSGGHEIVSAGGAASGTVIASGGIEYVRGITRSDTVRSGGLEIVSSGGVMSAVTINGGRVELISGGSVGGASGTIAFQSGGTLQLDASTLFGGRIAGFGLPDVLDLRDIAFVSGTTTASFVEAAGNTSGTLTVTDGTHTAHLKLLGSYTTSQFHLAADGHGGTMVTDPPAGGAAMTFADLAPAGPPSAAAGAAPADGAGTAGFTAGDTGGSLLTLEITVGHDLPPRSPG